jgi:hypothetical protein
MVPPGYDEFNDIDTVLLDARATGGTATGYRTGTRKKSTGLTIRYTGSTMGLTRRVQPLALNSSCTIISSLWRTMHGYHHQDGERDARDVSEITHNHLLSAGTTARIVWDDYGTTYNLAEYQARDREGRGLYRGRSSVLRPRWAGLSRGRGFASHRRGH